MFDCVTIAFDLDLTSIGVALGRYLPASSMHFVVFLFGLYFCEMH